ncbi:MAG: CHAT domain-containing protein, partial [Acidimicrobiia bacterium]|nr:CHAT domain-containing protein [Acidimicrobiia bacterium]
KRPLADVFAEALVSTADPAPLGHNGKFGAGIANARRLIESELPDPDGVGPAIRRRAEPAPPTDLAAVEREFDVVDRAGRVRLARSVGVRPQDLPIDLGGMADELLFHVMTDPARRELAFGADHLQPGEVEEGLVRTSDPTATVPATRTARSGGAVAPPPLSPKLAERLGIGPPPGPGEDDDGGEPGWDTQIPDRVVDVADDEFVVVGADWEVGWTLDQLDRTGTLVVVIERPRGPETDYYLRHRSQLESIDPNRTIVDGLDLHESGVSPTMEAIAPLERARRIDEPTVVIDNGFVAGFLLPVREAAVAPPPRTRRRMTRGDGDGSATRGADGGDEAPVETVTRRLEAELPSRASVDEEVSIIVSLSAEGVLGDLTVGADVLGRIGDTVDIVLSTRSGVELAGPHQHQIAITADGAPQYRQFKVRAIAPGQASMQLLAFIDGQSLAVLPLGLQVVDAPAEEPEQPLRAVATLEPPPYEDPDLTLLIYEQVLPGQGPSLQFTLTGRDPDLELNFEPFGHVGFRADPDTFFAEYFGDIEELLPPTHFPADVVDRKVKAMGAKLYDDVVPADLRNRLWTIRDRVKSILIQSTDPWVPWEMCFLTGPDETDTIVEHGFVCERYDVSRWIQGVPFQVDLALDRMALVVTGDSGLPSAQAEAAAVRRLQDVGIQVDDVPATYDAVYQALAGGSYTGFHFTGHGLYPQGVDPNRSQIQLEGGIPFRARDLGGVAKNLEQSSPLVLLNACQAGRGGMGLVGAGGWATALLNAGAGAFVGAHWSVLDDSAARFSEVFYVRLLAGDTLAGAVRRARAAIRKPGDPTWLAYVLYATCGVRAGLPGSDHTPE